MSLKFDITADVKNLFFDRKKIERAVDAASRKAISKSLAYVRTAARSKLRRRKRASRPGEPPSVHSTDPSATLKRILFYYDPGTKSGVVGPVRVNSRTRGSRPLPGLMEMGGTLVKQRGEYLVNTRSKRARPRKLSRPVSVRIEARPFMLPALQQEVEKGNVLQPWHNVVTG